METFQRVWQTVNDKFYDPNFNGVDWKAVRERYAPRVAKLESDDQLYDVLEDMLGELKVSHFGIVPPQDANEKISESDPSFGGGAGMTVRVVEGKPTITELDPSGPAAEAGLRPGFIVTRVGEQRLADLQEKLEARYDRAVMRDFRLRRAVDTLLGGMPGSAVEVAYLDASGAPKSVSVTRRDLPGRPMKFGEMPTVLTRVEARRLAGDVGYLKFNIFMPPMMEEIRAAMRSFKGALGVIIDLRGNPGGVGAMAAGISALLAKEQILLGTMKMRRGEIRFVTFPQDDPYTGPVVILTDEGSASTSEVMAGGLQESGRAVIVGGPTLGAVLPSLIERLPNGAVLQYAVADFKTPKGVLLEGRGVLPDLPVIPTRADFLAGRDLVLEEALRRLQK
jgi:carboxyl-terminal processing protease